MSDVGLRRLVAARFRRFVAEHPEIKQHEVATRLGVAYATAGHYMRGERQIPLDRLERLAAWIGIDLVELLTDPRREAGALGLSLEAVEVAHVYDRAGEERQRLARDVLGMSGGAEAGALSDEDAEIRRQLMSLTDGQRGTLRGLLRKLLAQQKARNAR